MAIYDKITKDILQYLYEGYIQHHGTPIFNVSQIINEHGESMSEVGNYLVDKGLVKFQRFGPDGFSASISIKGIRQIKPNYLEDNLNRVVAYLGMNGNENTSIMKILDIQRADFQIARDIAEYIKSRGLITVAPTGNDVFVKLNYEGRNYYEENKATFL